MTRDSILAALKQLRPNSGLTDDQLLWEAAADLEAEGTLKNFPVLETEMIRQRAQYDVADRGFVQDMVAAGKRGFASGMQGFNALQGAEDPTNAQDIADWEKVIAANPASEELTKFAEAEGFIASAKAFASNPIDIIAEVMVESMGASLPSIAGGVAGAAIGGAKGLAAGPWGAAVGGAVGVGAGSFAVEYAATMLDSMREQGMDPSDPLSVQMFFQNPEAVAKAKETAVKRAVPVAVFDAASAGLAGRFVAPLKTLAEKGGEVAVRRVLTASVGEIGIQAGTGMAGEAAGQAASGQKFDGKSVFLEGVAEVGSAPVEIRQNLGEFKRPAQAPAAAQAQPVAQPQATPTAAPITATVPEVKPFYETPTPNPAVEEAVRRANAVRAVPVGEQAYFPGMEPATARQRAVEAAAVAPKTAAEPAPAATPAVADAAGQMSLDLRARVSVETAALLDQARELAKYRQYDSARQLVSQAYGSLRPESGPSSRENRLFNQELNRVIRQAEVDVEAIAKQNEAYVNKVNPGEQTYLPGVLPKVPGQRQREREAASTFVDPSAQPAPVAPFTEATPTKGQLPLDFRAKAPAAKPTPAAPTGTPQEPSLPGLEQTPVATTVNPVEVPPAPPAPEGTQTELDFNAPSTPAPAPAAPLFKKEDVLRAVPMSMDPTEVNKQSKTYAKGDATRTTLGLVLQDVTTGQHFVVPVKKFRAKDAMDLIIGRNLEKGEIMEALSRDPELVSPKTGMRLSIPAINRALYNEKVIKDGKPNMEVINSAAREGTRKLRLRLAEKALALGWEKHPGPVVVNSLDYFKENKNYKAVSQVITRQELPAGMTPTDVTEEYVNSLALVEAPKKAQRGPSQFKADRIEDTTKRLIARYIPSEDKADPVRAQNEYVLLTEIDEANAAKRAKLMDELVPAVGEETTAARLGILTEAIAKVYAKFKEVEDRARAVNERDRKIDEKAKAIAAQELRNEPSSDIEDVEFKKKHRALINKYKSQQFDENAAAKKPATKKVVTPEVTESPVNLVNFLNDPDKAKRKANIRATRTALEQATGERGTVNRAPLAELLGRPMPKSEVEVGRLIDLVSEQLKDAEAKVEPRPAKKASKPKEKKVAVGAVDPNDPPWDTDSMRRLQPEEWEARRFLRDDDHRMGTFEAQQLIDDIVYTGASRGVRIVLTEATKDLKAGGTYSPSKREVAIILNSVLHPDINSVLNALHEVTHVILEDAPPEIRQAFHRFVERIPYGKDAMYQNPLADPRIATGEGLTADQLVIERGVEHLALQGIDRQYSRGVLSAIVRAFKDYTLRALIYLQKAFLGEERTSGALAERWMANEVAKVLAGDTRTFNEFLAQFGRQPTFAEVFRMRHGFRHQDTAVKIDLASGEMVYRPTDRLSDAAANVEAAFISAKESAANRGELTLEQDIKALEETLGPDVMRRVQPHDFTANTGKMMLRNAIAELEANTAVVNAVMPLYLDLLAKVKNAQPNIDKAQRDALRRDGSPVPDAIETVEDLFSVMGIKDPRAALSEARAKFESLFEQEMGTKVPEGFVNTKVTVDQLQGAARDRADRIMAGEFVAARNKTARLLHDMREEINTLSEKAEYNRAVLRSVMQNLADMKTTRKILNHSIAAHFKALVNGLRNESVNERAMGEDVGLLQALEKENDRRVLSERYTGRLLDSIAIDEMPLASMMKDIHDLFERNGLDPVTSNVELLRRTVIEYVLANPESDLKYLVSIGEGVGARHRGTAMLSAVLNFMRQETLISEVIRVQMSKGEERVRALTTLQKLYSETNEAALSELTAQLKTMGSVTSDYSKTTEIPNLDAKPAHAMLSARDQALQEQARLAKLKRDHAVLTSGNGLLNQLVNAAEARLEKGSRYIHMNGANYLHARTTDATDDNIRSAAVSNVMVLSGPNAFTTEQIRKIILDNEAWMEARNGDPTKQGYVYQSIKDQTQEMKRALYGGPARETVAGYRNGVLFGLADAFLRTGTRAGERAAHLFNQFVAAQRSYAAQATVNGNRYENLRNDFQKKAGVDDDTFTELFYNPARWFMDYFKGTELEAFHELDRKFASSASASGYWKKPGAKEAFFLLLRDVRLQNALQNKFAYKVGADRVEDPSLSDASAFNREDVGPQERRRLDTGVEGYTSWTNLHPDFDRWAKAFNAKVTGDGPSNVFSHLNLKMNLETMREELAAKTRAMFSEDDWQSFLLPLMLNEAGGMPTPVRMDGTISVVTPTVVRQVLARTGNDLVAVVQELAREYNTDPDAYLVSVLNWVRSEWESVNKLVNAAVDAEGSIVSIPTLGLTARGASVMPKEWVSYPQYTPDDHRRAAHLIAANGVFGRNGSVLRKTIVETGLEVEAMKKDIAAAGLNERDLNHPSWAEFKKTNPTEYRRLRTLAEYRIPDFRRIVESILQTESDLWTQMHWAREIFGGVTVGMVSGLKSAIKNPISSLNLIYAQRSASPEVLKTVAGAYAKTGRLFFASLLQNFGVDLLKTNPILRSMVNGGAFDAANHMTVKDSFVGEKGASDSLGKFSRTMRRMRNFYTNTRLSPLSKNGTAPAMRLLNPFQFTQVLVNMANTWQLMETYAQMAKTGAAVYQNDPNFSGDLTAADVGMKDQVAFTERKRMLAENGISLEELARDVAKGKDIFDDALVQATHNIALGVLANEASALNRPTALSRSKVGQMAGTFVGWGIDQTFKTFKQFETPEGRMNLSSLARGAMILSIGILPASLAYATLLDEWDELIEKKQNRRAVSLADPESIVEGLVATGAVGLFADAVDAMTNTRRAPGSTNDFMSLDNRIVLISSMRGILQGISNINQVGIENVNYANVMRPLAMAFGANGVLQNAYVMNRLFPAMTDIPVIGGVLESESRLALRGNMYNYIRVAGREAGLEVRAMGGSSSYSMNAMTPAVTNMVLAALSNDNEGFRAAYRDAIRLAREDGHLDPLKAVQQRYAQRHPLISLFKSRPMVHEVQKLMSTMSPEGRAAVEAGLRNFNRYAASLGATPFIGMTEPGEAYIRRMVRERYEASPDLLDSVYNRASQFRDSL